MKKIYLAGRFSTQKKLKNYRGSLNWAGHHVTSRWLDAVRPDMADVEKVEQFFRAWSIIDIQDIDDCDVFVIFADDPGSRGGMHGELGYALGKEKLIIVVGEKHPYPNFLYYHCGVRHYVSNFSQALEIIEEGE